MAQLPIDFCRRVATARRAMGLTQSALARSAGCAQSAISMFESGHPEKLSTEFVKKVAKILEIPFESGATDSPVPAKSAELLEKGYCPNAGCLSNIPYVMNGVLVFQPSPKVAGETNRYCTVCGEVLERSCPECGCRVTEGAFCAECGNVRIIGTAPTGVLPGEWAAARREEIREFRSFNLRQ